MYFVAGVSKIENFTDLNAWKIAHKLVISIYRLTSEFPPEEKFGLSGQLRRASISVTSNIAEGFARKTKAEKNRFYEIAQGSNFEIQSQLIAARDLGFIQNTDFNMTFKISIQAGKLMSGLSKSAKTYLPIQDTSHNIQDSSV